MAREHEQAAGSITDMVAVAQRLRQVRTACRQFLKLWAFEQSAGREASAAPAEEIDTALSDPANRDWSLLYRGSILDD